MSDTPMFSVLPDFALLEISGPDSERFLQGQLTCDVAALSAGLWTLGACCTAKGRMVANFVIGRRDTTFWLRMPREQVPALRQHLSRYAVFFKATLTDRSDDWEVLGHVPVAGTQPQRLEQPQPLHPIDEGLELRWPDGRRERWQPAARELPADSGAWASADLQLGLVWVTAASREEWVPQHIDWQLHGGVSFRKGCYTGQEIVARLQYLGKSKKQLVSIRSEQPLTLSILSVLQDEHGKNSAEIAAWTGQQGLAVCSGDSLPAVLYAGDISLTVARLFYTDSSDNGTDTEPAHEQPGPTGKR